MEGRYEFSQNIEVNPMKLLIAEDEQEICRALKVILEHNKYTVDVVTNGSDAIDYILEGCYDGIILDIMMPGKDGLQVLQELRAHHVQTPVLLLTAKSELGDRVAGLEAGADDYLPKPFATTELIARVKALLRRSGNYTPDVLTFGNLSLNCSTYELSTPAQALRLNNKEFQMIELFLRNPQKVFSTEQLMERIWSWESNAEINVVWTNIAYLRKKLNLLKASVEIKSIRGVGYCLGEI